MQPVVMDDYVEPMPMDYLSDGVPTYDFPETMRVRMIYDNEIYRELQTGIWDVCVSILSGMVQRYSFKAHVCKCSVVAGEIGKPLCMDWYITQTTPFEIETFGVRQKRKIRVKGGK
jgi:hypothetical protein